MRMTHRHVLAVVTSVLAACSGNEPTPAESIGPGNDRLILTLSAQIDSIPESTSKLLTARVTDLTGFVKSAPVSWTSTDPAIVSVSNGRVTANGRGVASVIASTTGAADTALIVVTENDIVLDVQPSAAAVAMGDTVNFTATMRTRAGDIVEVNSFTWAASDTNAASFVSAGMLRTKREGELSVTAEALARQGSGTVKVFKSPVASVTISPSTANLYRGASTTLVVTLRDQNGRLVEGDVTWGSSDYSTATVNADGEVTGVSIGTVVITATAERKTASATINVMNPPAAALNLTVPSSTLLVGAEMQATATATDAAGTPLLGKTIAYQSSNPAVATVNNTGNVKGIAEGSVTISAIADGVIARQPVAVKGGKATSISISPAAPSINVGTQSQLTAVVLDQNGSPMANQAIAWSSSNTAVASITSSGLVTGVSSGSAVITATSGPLSASVNASVLNAPVASVRVSPTSVSLMAGKQGSATAEALDAGGNVLTGRVVTWSSQNPAIVTVTNAGVITGIAAGTTTLTATIEGKAAGLPVTISAAPLAPVAAIQVALNAAALNVGEQTQAFATLTDASGNVLSGRAITWYSLDTAVAKVSASGVVTAYSGGTVAIMAASEGKTGSASLTVNTPTAAPVASVAIDVPTQDLTAGESVQAVVTLYDAAGNVLNGRTITYASDNPSVITVSASGVVKAIGGGSTKMRVSSGGVAVAETFRVTGSSTLSSITVSPSSTTLSVGQTLQASASAASTQGAAMAATFTWTTSNAAVATVSGNGLVTAQGAGSAVVTASSSGVTGSMAVNVTTSGAPSTSVASVTVTLSSSSILVGGTAQATAVARNSSGSVLTGKTATWALGVSQLASISASGLISGLAAGVVPVTATIDGVTGSASLTITSPLSPPPATANVELPRTYLNFSYPAKTGQTIVVPPGGNLQTAINNAQRGDEIVLTAGATYSGNFVLPAKSGTSANGWIVIRSDKSGQLPPAGTRVTPSHASLMAKIETPNVSPAIGTSGATSGWWLVGLDVTVSASVTAQQYGILTLGNLGSAQSTLSSVPSDIVLDRMYIHGLTTTNTSRCVALNSARSQVSDSYLDQCHGKDFDSQAIWGGNGPGPYKIVNNYLAGAGENIMFGGSDPAIPNLVPSDIEIRRNHFYTPPSWRGVWQKKNLLELKNASRLLIEGNIFDGSWSDAQTGWAMIIKSENQSGGCMWCRTTDVTIRKNLIRNAGAGIGVAGRGHNSTDSTTRRILISENVLENIGVSGFDGDKRGFQLLKETAYITIERTVLAGSLMSAMYLDVSPGSLNDVFRDNVWTHGMYGVIATGTGGGTPALNQGAPGWTWSNMTFVGSGGGYPTSTFWVSSESGAPLASQIRAIVSQAVSGVP